MGKKRVYFGDNSVFKAVKDVGKPGLHTRGEFVRLCLAQLLDLADCKTKTNRGRTVKWTPQLWHQRYWILRRLNERKKFRCTRMVAEIERVGKAFLEGKATLKHLVAVAQKWAKRYKVSVPELERLAEKVTKQRKVLKTLIDYIDSDVKKAIEEHSKKKRISRKEAAKRAVKLGKRVARRLVKRFDEETKRIARYLWSEIPDRYKRKPLRIWYFVMVLHLARLIKNLCAKKHIDWRSLDWASEIDWRQGYRYAKHYVTSLLRTGLDKYEGLTEKDIDEMMKYYERQAAALMEYG